MTPKKKPTAIELVRQLAAQVAELRGRIEVLEAKPSMNLVTMPPEPKPSGWWREFWR